MPFDDPAAEVPAEQPIEAAASAFEHPDDVDARYVLTALGAAALERFSGAGPSA